MRQNKGLKNARECLIEWIYGDGKTEKVVLESLFCWKNDGLFWQRERRGEKLNVGVSNERRNMGETWEKQCVYCFVCFSCCTFVNCSWEQLKIMCFYLLHQPHVFGLVYNFVLAYYADTKESQSYDQHLWMNNHYEKQVELVWRVGH